MRFTVSVSALLAMAASAFAQTPGFDAVTVPTSWQDVPAGSKFTIQWLAPAEYAADSVTIQLIGGPTQQTQQILSTIATGIANSAGSYTWQVDPSLGADNVYGLIIRDEKDTSVFQYSNPFRIIKAAAASTTPAGNTPVAAETSTVTSAPVTQTIILSSHSATSTPSTTPIPVIATTLFQNATTTVPCYNSTTLATSTKLPPAPQTPISPPSPPVAIVSSASPAAPSPAAPSASAPGNATATARPPVTAGGVRVGAGSMAVIGGLVVAFFAL